MKDKEARAEIQRVEKKFNDLMWDIAQRLGTYGPSSGFASGNDLSSFELEIKTLKNAVLVLQKYQNEQIEKAKPRCPQCDQVLSDEAQELVRRILESQQKAMQMQDELEQAHKGKKK